MLKYKIFRKAASLNFKRDPSAPNDWHNNDGVNSQDILELCDDDEVIFSCPSQTVSNAEGLIKGAHEYDTIAPGKFFIRAFVDPRAFKCQPHGIVGATTKHGDLIRSDVDKHGKPTEKDSTTGSNLSRWLVHDWKDHNNPPKDTRVAWSAGCFVEPDADLVRLNTILLARGVKPYALIPAELFEESKS
jgi:hypothetical protein